MKSWFASTISFFILIIFYTRNVKFHKCLYIYRTTLQTRYPSFFNSISESFLHLKKIQCKFWFAKYIYQRSLGMLLFRWGEFFKGEGVYEFVTRQFSLAWINVKGLFIRSPNIHVIQKLHIRINKMSITFSANQRWWFSFFFFQIFRWPNALINLNTCITILE